jgi:hypothetical protein
MEMPLRAAFASPLTIELLPITTPPTITVARCASC